MFRRTWKPIAVLAAAVMLVVGVRPEAPAAAQDDRDAQTELADLLLKDGATRGQTAQDLVRVLEVVGFQPPECVPGQEMFDDVPADSPFCPFVEELARRGITTGCGDGNFCPNATLARQQMAIFIVRTLEAAGTGPAGGDLTGSYPNPTIGARKVGRAKLANGAVTAPKLGEIQEVTDSIILKADGGFDEISVSCPADTKVIGGGVDTGFAVRVVGDMRDGNGWLARGQNTHLTASTSLTVYAYCLAG